MFDVKVLVIEDEPIIAEDIRDYLDELDFQVVGIAHRSEDALDMLANRSVDIALVDIYIDGSMDGIEVAEIIHRTYKIPFIYLTSLSDKATVDRAKHTFPYGYIVKPFDERDLLSNLEMALFKHASERRSLVPPIDEVNQRLTVTLTAKEFEIALDISKGMINRQMAEKHFISVNTVKTHIKHLYEKLDVNNRAGLIRKISGSN